MNLPTWLRSKVSSPELSQAKEILSLFGDVLYDFGLYSDKISFAGRYQMPLKLAGPPIIVGGWLKIPVDTRLLPKAVFKEDLQDERLLSALRMATGCNVECRFSDQMVLPSLMTEKRAKKKSDFGVFDFWYLVELDDEMLRGIPRLVDFSELPEPDSLEFEALPIPLGVSVSDTFKYFDLIELDSMLVAGMTRQGKSVFLRQILEYLALHFSPARFGAILGDFKFGVEFSQYSDRPHFEVCSSPAEILDRVEGLTEERFSEVIRPAGCRSIRDFNAQSDEPLSYILAVIDEFSAFRVAGKTTLTRAENLAARSVGAGIHWLLSTQRPSVDIVTGSLKANLGSRISFSLSSEIDTKVVFDREIPECVRVGCRGRAFAAISDQFIEFQSSYVA